MDINKNNLLQNTKKCEDVASVNKIVCPHCGYQYDPSEIYFPEELTGKAETIIRDPLGHIIYRDYKPENNPELVEHFICDHCGKAFKVSANITYTSSAEDEDKDFTEEYVSLI